MLDGSADSVSEERVVGLRGIGVLLYAQREYAEAYKYLKAALEMSRVLGNEALTATLTGNLSTVIGEQGDIDGAWELQQAALSIRRALGDDLGVATSLANLGALAFRRSDYAQARSYFEQSIAMNRVTGDIGSSILSLNNLGSTLIEQGDWSSAVPVFLEGLTIAHDLGEREIAISCISGLGEAAFAQKQMERAVRLDAATEAMREALGQPLHPGDQEREDRYRATLRAEAGDAFERLWNEGKAMSSEHAIEYALAVEEPAPLTTQPVSRDSTIGAITRREREVVALIVRGLTNRQIADELTIAERTADTHVSNILTKLGLTPRAQVAAWAVANGLTTIEAR